MNIKYSDLNYYDLQRYIEMNGIDSNTPCICGSELKFKDCCRDNQIGGVSEALRLQEEINRRLNSNSHIGVDECLLSTCHEKAIMSHAIQKNGYLDMLAINEHLYIFSKAFNQGKYYVRDNKVSINNATTFYGFCNFHDTKMFLDIEVYQGEEFIKNRLMAHTYRSIAYKYRRTVNELKLIESDLFMKFPLLYLNEVYNPDFIVYQAYLISNYHTKKSHKSILKNILYELEQCYDISRNIWTMHKDIVFSDVVKVSGTSNPIVFFCSDVINSEDMFMCKQSCSDVIEIITLMVLPNQDGSLNSAFLSSYGTHSSLIDFFNKCDGQIRLNIINNIILNHLNELFLSERQMKIIKESKDFSIIENRLLEQIRIEANNVDIEDLSKIPLINFFE